MNNTEKQASYALNKTRLKKALSSEFWLEAIFIEYALIEDRTESVLRHAGTVKMVDKRGNPLKLSKKLSDIKSCKPFTEDKKLRKYLPFELIDEIWAWKADRDNFIHALLKTPYGEEEIKAIAEEGDRLYGILDSRVRSVNRILDKRNSKAGENQ